MPASAGRQDTQADDDGGVVTGGGGDGGGSGGGGGAVLVRCGVGVVTGWDVATTRGLARAAAGGAFGCCGAALVVDDGALVVLVLVLVLVVVVISVVVEALGVTGAVGSADVVPEPHAARVRVSAVIARRPERGRGFRMGARSQGGGGWVGPTLTANVARRVPTT